MRRAVTAAAVVVAALVVSSGCTDGSPGPGSGSAAWPTSAVDGGGGQLRGAVAPVAPPMTAAAAPPGSGSASHPAPAAAGSSLLQLMNGPGCRPATAAVNLQRAGGAWRTYVSAPLASRRFTAGAPQRAVSLAHAREAAAYTATRLRSASASLGACATTSRPLVAVLRQESTAIEAVSRDLARGMLVAARVEAVETLHTAMTAQATRVGFTLGDVVPTLNEVSARR